MTPLTMKILASLMQLHSPEAGITSDNHGVRELLGVVREQMAEETASRAGLTQVAKKSPYRKGHGKTIFRKGGYEKSVYGPQHKKIILD